MMRRAALFVVIAASAALAQGPESFEIEPPLLIPNRTGAAGSTSDAQPQDVDIAKLEKDLERAKRNADAAPHLCRIGVISQVEVEQRALRVVRLEAELANARLESAQAQTATRSWVTVNGEAAVDAATKAELAQLTEAAQAADAKRHRVEIELAEANLQRQLRLLAVGSARKSDVSRAEEKLAQLKGQQN
ncbi:MAG TPA: hypothetical protein VFO30_07455 [Chthoniobacterales bacterium]|nr:hypothetical protein [Chthoniobacterales bacterium]